MIATGKVIRWALFALPLVVGVSFAIYALAHSFLEGLLIVPSMPAARFARLCETHGLRLLDPSCCVAMYRIYDCRMLFDFVEADAVSQIPQTGPSD